MGHISGCDDIVDLKTAAGYVAGGTVGLGLSPGPAAAAGIIAAAITGPLAPIASVVAMTATTAILTYLGARGGVETTKRL